MTSAQVIALVIARRHDPTRGWVCCTEVSSSLARLGTHGTDRRADLIAVPVWESLGLRIVGYEVKVSRTDWLNELDDPAKREWLEAHCAETWFACGPGVAKLEEVPVGWGLLEVQGERLMRRRAAQRRDVQLSPRVLLTMLRKTSYELAEAKRHDITCRLDGVEVTKAQLEAAANAQLETTRALVERELSDATETRRQLAAERERIQAPLRKLREAAFRADRKSCGYKSIEDMTADDVDRFLMIARGQSVNLVLHRMKELESALAAARKDVEAMAGEQMPLAAVGGAGGWR